MVSARSQILEHEQQLKTTTGQSWQLNSDSFTGTVCLVAHLSGIIQAIQWRTQPKSRAGTKAGPLLDQDLPYASLVEQICLKSAPAMRRVLLKAVVFLKITDQNFDNAQIHINLATLEELPVNDRLKLQLAKAVIHGERRFIKTGIIGDAAFCPEIESLAKNVGSRTKKVIFLRQNSKEQNLLKSADLIWVKKELLNNFTTP